MNKYIPALSVILSLIFTLSVALAGCRPAEENATEPSNSSTAETGDTQMNTQMPGTSAPTQAASEPSDRPTDPVSPTQGVTAPTQNVTQPTQGTTQPTQGSTSPTQGTAAPTQPVTQPTQSNISPTHGSETETQATTAATEQTTLPLDSTIAPTEVQTQPTSPLLPNDVTYKMYLDMTDEEKSQFRKQFSSTVDFIDWYNKAEDAYLESLNSGGNNIDLDDIVNGNK